MELKLLFIEDDEKLGEGLKKNFHNLRIGEYTLNASLVTIFEEGLKNIIENDYDLIILDLYKDKEGKDTHAGLKVLEQIRQSTFVPVIFYTGHAYKIVEVISEIVGVVSKGDGIEVLEKEIERVITSKLVSIKNSIKTYLSEFSRKYFWEIVDKNKDVFIPGKNDVSLGYLLLRKFSSSLSKEGIKELLNDDKISVEKAHPMEFYIYPANEGEYESGEILGKDGFNYIILTPSCDFILEPKRPRKVGQVLLARAEKLVDSEIYKKYLSDKVKNKQSLVSLIESRKGDRYFFLPGTPFIQNSFLDFQDKIIISYEDLKSYTRIAKLDDPYAQSMTASFIRYYNRIGFPDLDSEFIINSL